MSSAGARPSTRYSHASVPKAMAELRAAHRAAARALKPGLRRCDLTWLVELGVGMSGQVYLVRCPTQRGAPTLAVVKVMSKAKIARLKQVPYVMRERAALKAWDCPHIVTYLASFQDGACLHLVLEFCSGGDLFQRLVDSGCLEPDAARFYGAEVLLALAFIHNAGWVYRDLKPENILLEGNGHAKLADSASASLDPRGSRGRRVPALTRPPRSGLCKGAHRGRADVHHMRHRGLYGARNVR